jgi:ABC-type Fe3+ transport system permease subunit
MLAAVDWHVVWERLFHPDEIFLRALLTTVYIAVAAQILGVVLGSSRRSCACRTSPR